MIVLWYLYGRSTYPSHSNHSCNSLLNSQVICKEYPDKTLHSHLLSMGYEMEGKELNLADNSVVTLLGTCQIIGGFQSSEMKRNNLIHAWAQKPFFDFDVHLYICIQQSTI